MSDPLDQSARLLEVLERLVQLLEELLKRTDPGQTSHPVPPRPPRP